MLCMLIQSMGPITAQCHGITRTKLHQSITVQALVTE
jgi:hypothetical protein